MSARDRNAGYDASMAEATGRPEPELAELAAGLMLGLHRLTLTLELERLERLGYDTGVMVKRRARMDEIRRELGWVA